MLNLLNFAAVPFNSPIYEQKERGTEELREEVRREVRMEVMRELQDRESHASRLLLSQEHSRGISSARRQSHISRLSFGAMQKEPALTCLVLPDTRSRATDEMELRGSNGGLDEENTFQPPEERERGREEREQREERCSKVPLAASLICLLLLFSLFKR